MLSQCYSDCQDCEKTRGLLMHCLWAIRPVEALSLSLLSSGGLIIHSPHHHRQLSPTSPSSLSSVGHLSCRGLVVCSLHRLCQPSPTSLLSSSSTGNLSCRGFILVVIWWGPCHHWGSSSVPHIVVIVISRTLVLQRPHCPSPMLSSSSLLSSLGHLSCGGLIAVIVR